MTSKYGHRRFKYEINISGTIKLDLVPIQCVQYPAFFVFDPMVMIKLFGLHCTEVDSFENEQHRVNSRFFKVATVRLTSFRECLN